MIIRITSIIISFDNRFETSIISSPDHLSSKSRSNRARCAKTSACANRPGAIAFFFMHGASKNIATLVSIYCVYAEATSAPRTFAGHSPALPKCGIINRLGGTCNTLLGPPPGAIRTAKAYRGPTPGSATCTRSIVEHFRPPFCVMTVDGGGARMRKSAQTKWPRPRESSSFLLLIDCWGKKKWRSYRLMVVSRVSSLDLVKSSCAKSS